MGGSIDDRSSPKFGLLHLREFSLMYLVLMKIPLILSTTVGIGP